MAMSRKDYIAVADGLRYSAGILVNWGEMTMGQYLEIINSVSNQLARTSVRFNSDRFLDACMDGVSYGSNKA